MKPITACEKDYHFTILSAAWCYRLHALCWTELIAPDLNQLLCSAFYHVSACLNVVVFFLPRSLARLSETFRGRNRPVSYNRHLGLILLMHALKLDYHEAYICSIPSMPILACSIHLAPTWRTLVYSYLKLKADEINICEYELKVHMARDDLKFHRPSLWPSEHLFPI